MKIITLIISFALTVSFCNAQLSYSSATTPFLSNDTSQMGATVTITNNSATAVDVKCERTIVYLAPGHGTNFCWDVCYDTTIDISVNALAVAAGDTAENFYGDYEANGIAGVSTIKYCFYNQQNSADSICYIAYFNASATSVESMVFGDENKLSTAFPNPATGTTKITYSLKNDARSGKILVHNMLGALVKTIELKEKFATLEIPLAELQSCIYFYSMEVDSKTIATKKLVVTR